MLILSLNVRGEGADSLSHKMYTALELENAARGYVTLENFIKVREDELAGLYRDSSAVAIKIHRLVVAIARLGQVADFSNQRLENLVTRHANYLADADRIAADITYVQGRLVELRSWFYPLWPIAGDPAVARARCQVNLESVLDEIRVLEVRVRRHHRRHRGESFWFNYFTQQTLVPTPPFIQLFSSR